MRSTPGQGYFRVENDIKQGQDLPRGMTWHFQPDPSTTFWPKFSPVFQESGQSPRQIK